MPETLNDFAAREPSPAESGRLRLTRLIVTTNVVLAGLLSAISFVNSLLARRRLSSDVPAYHLA